MQQPVPCASILPTDYKPQAKACGRALVGLDIAVFNNGSPFVVFVEDGFASFFWRGVGCNHTLLQHGLFHIGFIQKKLNLG